jgi:hypothetical protein
MRLSLTVKLAWACALVPLTIIAACDSSPSPTPTQPDRIPVYPPNGDMKIVEGNRFELPSNSPDYDVHVFHDDKRGETCWIFHEHSAATVAVWCENDNALCLNGVFGPNKQPTKQ